MTTASNAGTVSFDDPSDSYKISDKGTVGFRAATQTWPVVIVSNLSAASTSRAHILRRG